MLIPEETYERIMQYCEDKCGKTVVKLWIRPLVLIDTDQGHVKLSAVSQIQKKVIENAYVGILKDAFKKVLRMEEEIEIIYTDSNQTDDEEEDQNIQEDQVMLNDENTELLDSIDQNAEENEEELFSRKHLESRVHLNERTSPAKILRERTMHRKTEQEPPKIQQEEKPYIQTEVPTGRIAVIGIVLDDIGVSEQVNSILHEFSKIIIGRMGLPYRERNISVISVAVDAPSDIISSLTGKLGKISGVSVKAAISKK